MVVSRFGVIPKRGQENQWRLILDLSINDGVSRDSRPGSREHTTLGQGHSAGKD